MKLIAWIGALAPSAAVSQGGDSFAGRVWRPSNGKICIGNQGACGQQPGSARPRCGLPLAREAALAARERRRFGPREGRTRHASASERL